MWVGPMQLLKGQQQIQIQQMYKVILIITLIVGAASECQPCFYSDKNIGCQTPTQPFVLHMSVHPHLDAFWIYDFDTYYQTSADKVEAVGYLESNKMTPVKEIFDTALRVLAKSKKYREEFGDSSQKARRTFFNSEMGFFKHWYLHLNEQKQQLVKQLVKSGYWEIVGGGLVEHDEGCAYYEDIIQNYELGLHFLKQTFNFTPKVAIAADSFGHSQSTVAILAHIGIEGFFVERSDEHILQKNKTEFLWKAVSSNNITYGTVATHIRWAIHGYEDQFTYFNEEQNLCQQKQQYIENLRKQNKFLKQIIKSNHAMRYFGHDFQKFQEYQYEVIEAMMEQFSREKCENVIAEYTNPTEYFQIYIGEVMGKQKSIASRQQDIFPIWDFDSGLYWTGYFTTDPYHKKSYRDFSRFLHAVRKAFLLTYLSDPKSDQNKRSYELLEKFAETVAYLQHHDGISGTSKYTVMDEYEVKAEKLFWKISTSILGPAFENNYPLYTNSPIMICGISEECVVPKSVRGNIFVKIFNSGVRLSTEPIIIHLPLDTFYKPNCKYEIVCMCVNPPCSCQLYLYPDVFTFTEVLLTRSSKPQQIYYMKQVLSNNSVFSFNQTYIRLKNQNGPIEIGYKRVLAEETLRQYEHLSRYGQLRRRGFNINSGKYALGNNPNAITELSFIRKIYMIQTPNLKKILVIWKRQQMKTVIETSYAVKGSWKVTTLSAAQAGALQDLYVEFSANVKNQNKFYTDSNGWLVMGRKLNTREDFDPFFSEGGKDSINGNSYPMTAFSYIEDSLLRLTVNTDRPQGVIGLKQGRIWVNFDRLTSDDGKWVYQTTYRNQYQKFTHYVTLQNSGKPNKNEAARTIQQLYDQPLLIQLNQIEPNLRYEQPSKSAAQRNLWANLSGIQNTKFWVRVWNDSSMTLRIQNIYDDVSVKVGLFVDSLSPYLSTYYGNGVYFQSLEELSLGGNIKYEQFIANKWNLNQVVDLKHNNQIFNKVFAQNIQLRPLQIRTFRLKTINARICPQIEKLVTKNTIKEYKLNIDKQFPFRSPQSIEVERKIKQFLVQEDHCEGQSPVLFRKTQSGRQVNYNGVEQIVQNSDHAIVKAEEKYVEQVLAEDPHKNKKSLYQQLVQIEKLPLTKIPSQIKRSEENGQRKKQEIFTVKKQEQGEINKELEYNKEVVKKDESSLDKGKKEENLGRFEVSSDVKQIRQIRTKIISCKKLSKDEKEAYFRLKKKRIAQFLGEE